VTKWRITDQFRKRQKEIDHSGTSFRAPDETATIDRVAAPGGELEAIWDNEWEQNLVEAATERVKKKIDPKQYQLFDLYVVRKWSVLKITRTLKVNPGLIYLAKHRVNRLVRKEITYLRTKIA
jgi:hypothetical protein